jgi:L-threonylcarbamoyladenylate synthase
MARLVFPVDPVSPDPEVIAAAAARIRAGELVAFPTETVYGLGAHALNPEAVARIFAAKGRPATNPVIVHVPDAAAARALSSAWPAVADSLAERFWPGPLTLIVPAQDTVPSEVRAGLASVGVRVPAHPVALALLRAAGVPIAAPSANRSNQLSPTTAAHVRDGLGEAAGVILDGGPTDVGIESTVLDLTGPTPKVLRPGGITREQLEAVLGPVGLEAKAIAEASPRPAPGMMARHYAPRARLELLPPVRLESAALAHLAAGRRPGLLVIGAPAPAGARAIRLPGDPAGYARGLYAALHDLDAGADVILVEAPPALPAWEGVRDRLARGSHPA